MGRLNFYLLSLILMGVAAEDILERAKAKVRRLEEVIPIIEETEKLKSMLHHFEEEEALEANAKEMDVLSHKINEEYTNYASPEVPQAGSDIYEDYYPDYFRDDLVDRMEDDYRMVKPIGSRQAHTN